MDPEESPWADTGAAPPTTTTTTAADVPVPADADAPSQSSTATKASLSPPSQSSTATRGPRTPRRLVAQPTRLSAVDDPLGPLGGSGSDVESSGPPPPQKEVVTSRTTMQGGEQEGKRAGPRDPHSLGEDGDGDGGDGEGEGGRAPPPVQVASPTGREGLGAPGVSVEEAARVSFYITVGDPHKVGDLTSSHIVYSVRTKVRFSFFLWCVVWELKRN